MPMLATNPRTQHGRQQAQRQQPVGVAQYFVALLLRKAVASRVQSGKLMLHAETPVEITVKRFQKIFPCGIQEDAEPISSFCPYRQAQRRTRGAVSLKNCGKPLFWQRNLTRRERKTLDSLIYF